MCIIVQLINMYIGAGIGGQWGQMPPHKNSVWHCPHILQSVQYRLETI